MGVMSTKWDNAILFACQLVRLRGGQVFRDIIGGHFDHPHPYEGIIWLPWHLVEVDKEVKEMG